MTIRFYRLTDDGTTTVGEMILRKGEIVLNPPGQPTLQKILTEPHAEPNFETGEPIYFDPVKDPVPFLKSCVRVFRGSYFWCRELPASTEAESAASHRDTQEG